MEIAKGRSSPRAHILYPQSLLDDAHRDIGADRRESPGGIARVRGAFRLYSRGNRTIEREDRKATRSRLMNRIHVLLSSDESNNCISSQTNCYQIAGTLYKYLLSTECRSISITVEQLHQIHSGFTCIRSTPSLDITIRVTNTQIPISHSPNPSLYPTPHPSNTIHNPQRLPAPDPQPALPNANQTQSTSSTSTRRARASCRASTSRAHASNHAHAREAGLT